MIKEKITLKDKSNLNGSMNKYTKEKMNQMKKKMFNYKITVRGY